MAGYTQAQIVQIITEEANKLGVPVELALAIAKQESGFNYMNDSGDGGHSVGLFQLNDRGEGAGMTVAARQDPRTNARIALTQVANVMRSSPNLTGGALAAAAQRPADRAGYAQAINRLIKTPGPFGALIDSARNAAGAVSDAAGSTLGWGGAVGSTPINLRQFAASNGIPPQWINDPQLGPLIQAWDNGQMSDNEFYAKARETTIWKTTPVSERTYLADQATDHATLKQTVGQKADMIDQMSSQLGVKLDPKLELALATASITNNWTSQQLQEQIAARFDKTAPLFGEAATDTNSLRSIYQDYGLPVSDQKLNDQLAQLLSGKQSLTGLKSALVAQAKSLYSTNPQLSQFVDDQHSVKDWADPYLQHASSLLGINPNAMSLSAPMWQRVLNPASDPKTGLSAGAAMSIDQWDRELRTNPIYGYDTSANAVNSASQFANQLVSKFTGASL